MGQNTSVDLVLEAEYLYHCLFRNDSPPALIAHYLDAHETLPELFDAPFEQLRTMNVIVKKKLNAAAIEPWLRRKGPRHTLSAKLLLIAYLAECGGWQAGFSRRAESGRAVLIASLLGGFLGLLHGLYLKVRYGLI